VGFVAKVVCPTLSRLNVEHFELRHHSINMMTSTLLTSAFFVHSKRVYWFSRHTSHLLPILLLTYSQIMATMFNLLCYVRDDDYMQAFPVKIAKDEDVGTLKGAPASKKKTGG
jgi:hypothetical protein